MATTEKTYRFSPSRALRDTSGLLMDVRHTGSVTMAAVRALGADLVSGKNTSERTMSTHARTFRFATRFLPQSYREPTIRLYAFFRTLDDLVDEHPGNGHSAEEVYDELAHWESWFEAGCVGTPPREDIGRDVSSIRNEFGIPDHVFHEFLAGMRADLAPVTPDTRSDVERYSYQVASTVGIAMAHIFDARSPAALTAATRLGIAMQLTNILRDVGGDLARGRVYLPVEVLSAHSLSRHDVEQMWRTCSGPDARLREALREMATWADLEYAAGISGVRLLPPDVRMPILVSARLYQQILRQLERNDFDSLRVRVVTTRWQKAREAYNAAIDAESMALDSEAPAGESRIHAR